MAHYYSDFADKIIEEKLVSSESLPSRFVLNLGGEYRLGKVSLGLDIHNLLNKKYNQSGMNTGLVPQRGRWFLATLGYEF